MRRMVWALIVLLLVSSASAYVIADYPTMFFKNKQFTATIVKGEGGNSAERVAANLLLNDLQRTARRYGLKPNAIRTSTSGGTGDEILIGSPCANLRMRELLGIPPRNCQTAVKTGMLKIVQDKHIHLIITGPDGDSVLDAMKVLTDERHRTQLKVQNASVVRRLYRKYYLIGGGRFLDIGQTIGAETPTLYTGYPYVTYKPFDEYRGTTYGAIVTTSTSRQRAYFPTTSGA